MGNGLTAYRKPIMYVHAGLHTIYWGEAFLNAIGASSMALIYGCLAFLTIVVAYLQETE